MKKSFLFTLGLAILLFVSCASTSAVKVTCDVDIQYESDNPAVLLELEPVVYKSNFRGFICTFKNNSNKTARVVWEESSLNYFSNSYVPFIDGQKYTEAQEPMPAAAIPKGAMIIKTVYSSAQPYYYDYTYVNNWGGISGTKGWDMKLIYANTVQLSFMIKSDKGEEYITATVKAIPITEEK